MKEKKFNIYVDNQYIVTVIECLLKEALIFLINTLNFGANKKSSIEIEEVEE